jgi:intergrase/recombinase
LIKNNIIILNESVQQLVSTVKEDKSIDISTYILSNELCVSTFKMQEMLSELEKSYELLNDTFLSIKFLSNQIK